MDPGGALGEAPVEEVDLDRGLGLLLDRADEPRGNVARHADELVLSGLGVALRVGAAVGPGRDAGDDRVGT
eukprot:11152317-Alexandrium_andersonii.AAC.1